MMKIEDDVLISYGFKEEQWERRGGGYDNIVIIKDLQNPVNVHVAQI